MNSTIDVLFPPSRFSPAVVEAVVVVVLGGCGAATLVFVRKRHSRLVPSRTGPPSRFSRGSRRWILVQFMSSFFFNGS